ncbi:MAG: hypothetical protein ACTSWM_04485 [Alphaproteobacteria bacterium]
MVAACAPTTNRKTPDAPPQEPAAAVRPNLEWNTTLKGDVVEIVLTDPRSFYRVEQMELLGPDGRIYRATDITRLVTKDDGRSGGTRVGIGAGSGGRVSTGIGFSFPIGNRSSYNRTKTETRIPLRNPDFYRATASQWTIRVTLIDQAGQQSTADFPAPTN